MIKRLLVVCLSLLLIATQAAANDWLINSYRFAAAPAAPSLSYATSSGQNNPASATVTFSSISTGTAAADRDTIIVACGTDNATDFSILTLTVGGNPAVKVAQTNSASSRAYCSTWTIANPSGTTATIVATYSESLTGMASIHVWAAYGLPSLFPTDTGAGTGSTGASTAANLDVAVGDLVVGGCTSPTGSSTTTWGGLTERNDTVANGALQTAADLTAVSASTPLTVTCDPSTNTDDVGIVTAAFGAVPTTPTLVFQQCTAAGAQSGATQSSINTGMADASRTTIVGVAAADAAATYTINSLTVGGTGASKIVDQGAVGVVNNAAIFVISNPTGTTANLVATASETINGWTSCVWATYNLNSLTADSSNSAGCTSTCNINLATTQAGGIAVGVASGNQSDSQTWTGLTERAEVTSTGFTTENIRAGAADAATTGSALTISFASSAGNHRSIATAAFK